ncbi:MAG: hypothetical protein ACXADH_05380 [Candidatus Kariarchaeaceae archaeon]|jgi:hypothetical protein
MKKIAVSTWCTDDYAVHLRPDKLKKLVNHFHPEIDFHIVDTAQTEEIKKENPWMLSETVRYPDWMMVMSCLPFVEDYDMVIHMDADSFCIGSLDRVINSEAELIGVRNNNPYGKAGAASPCVSPFYPPYGDGGMIGVDQFLNAGFIASNDKQFWYEWKDFNKFVAEQSDGKTFTYRPWPMIRNEQDTWNHIFHAKDKYTSEIVDDDGSGVTYGVMNQWGQKEHCESWKELYVKNNEVFIDHPFTKQPLRTSVLHAAGVGTMETIKEYGDQYQWLYGIIKPEVAEYIKSIIGE